MKLFTLTTLLPATVLAQTQPFGDDQILATPTLFEISTSGNFTCVDPGSRCVYQREHFNDVEARNGQSTRNEEGDIWSAILPDQHFLEVYDCTTPPCYVKCNAKCTCQVVEDGSDCAVGTTRPPVAPPTPSPPVTQVCSKQQNRNHCRTLMPRVLPNNFFDCYNFCGGIFLSSCDFTTGKCGSLTCDNATDSGANSVVLGCTDADRPSGTGGASSSTNGGDSASGVSAMDLSFAAVVASGLVWLIL